MDWLVHWIACRWRPPCIPQQFFSYNRQVKKILLNEKRNSRVVKPFTTGINGQIIYDLYDVALNTKRNILKSETTSCYKKDAFGSKGGLKTTHSLQTTTTWTSSTMWLLEIDMKRKTPKWTYTSRVCGYINQHLIMDCTWWLDAPELHQPFLYRWICVPHVILGYVERI